MGIKTFLLTVAGYLSLLFGAIGLFLPVWPTTPFVILSAACFSSSPKLHSRIMKIAFFREHIENYRNRQGLSVKTLLASLIYLWGMLVLSMLAMSRTWTTYLLCAIGTVVTIHILHMSRASGPSK